ncbi:MAG: NAD(P)/FAD-dependent oxidoreductase, partial [Verrucomicrobia bacterium]|nr:NAD(P)/FAD-dependent oxidoreductase [Verrucomicrobiota bacterium]
MGTDLYAVSYDKLVLAPGIEFLPPPGNYDADLTPHAWRAGPQTLLLKNQLSAMASRQTFVLTIPRVPYRCPPGPYERACSVADFLKRKRPGARMVVLDANPGIQAEPVNFGKAFSERYKGVLTYVPNAVVLSVDSTARSVKTTAGTFTGAVLNLIPDQRAGQIVTDTGLVNDPTGRWALVHPLSYASTLHPDIHILGDSQGTGQPKSGHMANAQAKVCADAIIRSFNGEPPDPNPVTSSACFSPITSSIASWLTASFRYDPATASMKRVDPSFAEAPKPTSDGMQQMYQWADNIFADSFG